MTLSAIGQIAFVVRDIDASTTFYKDKLGIPFLFSAPPKLAFFDLAGIRLMLAEPENNDEAHRIGTNSTIYFKVDDIKSTFEAVKERGVEVAQEPHLVATMGTIELWMAFFRDLDQNLIGIMSEVPVK